MKKISLFAAMIASCFGLALGQGTPSPKSYTEAPGVRNDVPVSENTFERVSIQLAAGFDGDGVREALLNLKGWVPVQGYDLALRHEKASPFAVHYAYRQTFRGLPVYGAGIKATVSNAGRIMHLLNSLQPGLPGEVAGFSQSENDIAAHIRRTYGAEVESFEMTSEACYFLHQDVLVPAYRVEYTYGNSMWEEVLDGRTLATYRRRDLGSFHHGMMLMDTTGTGLVFDPDPLTSSGNTYGATASWQDNNDQDNPELNGQRFRVTLQDIDYSNGLFRLNGPYADLQDLESPNVPIATSTDGTFDYTRSESGFEDVMVYYHIDNYQRYVQSLGFTNLYNSPLLLDPHGLSGQDNSHFVPSGTTSRLAFGEGCVDDAEDADVIVHEYGHALSFSAAPATNSGTERLGLDEGIGDYIAASYSKARNFNLWKNTFTWDGHNTCWDGRSASDPTAYPPNTFNIYVYGAIWASCLMEAYDQIGREASDKVFFQSLYSNFQNMTLTDAAAVVIDADSLVFGGAHTAVYQDIFCRRGILTAGACIVSSPDPDLFSPTWHLFPNPTSDRVSILLEDYRPGADYSYRVVDLVGRVLQDGNLQPRQTDLGSTSLAPGIYLVQIMDGGRAVAQRKLVVER